GRRDLDCHVCCDQLRCDLVDAGTSSGGHLRRRPGRREWPERLGSGSSDWGSRRGPRLTFSDDELVRTAALLNTVFEHEQPLTLESLRWYYERNPVGPAAVGNVEEADRRLGNYALIPQKFVSADGGDLVLGVGVDLAVSPDARGGGVFRRTVEDSYLRAIDLGHDGILGVANANSAPRMVATLGWRALDPLPVTLCVPVGTGGGFTVAKATPAFFDSEVFAEIASSGFVHPSTVGFAPHWSPELLHWRLTRPGFRYWVHISEHLVVVSTRTRVAGVPFGVVLKTLVRHPLAAVLPGGQVAATVARTHRTPFVIHWGRAPMVHFRGLPLPQSRMPSPLSLVLHRHHDEFDEQGFELSAFEFLDFDAY
ncbi:MAG: GNAT family N-acetyltransferase, partial [Actinobacteria bacterium]|nr:GNAT family N-acetyltransferase [Actinomycetota bacterium]